MVMGSSPIAGVQKGGAAAARWAHNPKAEGSKPSPSKKYYL